MINSPHLSFYPLFIILICYTRQQNNSRWERGCCHPHGPAGWLPGWRGGAVHWVSRRWVYRLYALLQVWCQIQGKTWYMHVFCCVYTTYHLKHLKYRQLIYLYSSLQLWILMYLKSTKHTCSLISLTLYSTWLCHRKEEYPLAFNM